jgi:hypothetical protein
MSVETFASGSVLRSGESTERTAIYEQGLVAGALGAATIALWFFAVDLFNGRPLFTPSMLGTALFQGRAAVASPEHVAVSFEMVVVFTWIHVLVFFLIGIAASLLLELAEHNRNLGFGIVLLFVIFEFGFVAMSTIFAEGVLQALTLTRVLVGNFLAAGVMGLYFWRRHPGLVMEP